MSKKVVRWRDLEQWCHQFGYSIRSDGGDKLIVPPATDKTQRRTVCPVRIGHKFNTRKAELLDVHLMKLKRAFGISRIDILHMNPPP